MGKQILIRIGDELFSEIQKEAVAHRMTVQKYILSVIDTNMSLTRQIDKNVKQTLTDIYEERITNSITYGYLKRCLMHIEEKMNMILNAVPNAKLLTDEEKIDIQETANAIEMETFKDIVNGKDVFKVGRLYKMANAEDENKKSEDIGLYEEE